MRRPRRAGRVASVAVVGCLTVVFAAVVTGVRTANAGPSSTFDSQVAAHDGNGEPEVAVDVKDPNVLVDAYATGTAVSDDGGSHWRQVMSQGGGGVVSVGGFRGGAGRRGETPSRVGSAAFGPELQRGGDPVVVSDAAGDFYATDDSYSSIQKSTDEGRTWKKVGSPLHNPPPVGPSPQDMSVHPSDGPLYMGPSVFGCDRPLMGTDLDTGTLYATCADHGDQSGGEGASDWPAYFALCRTNIFSSGITTNCGRRYVSASHDHGKTWTRWEPEDAAGWPASYTGAFDGIPVAAHGVLATAYVAGSVPGNDCTQCAVFETSTNDGATWARHLVPGATPQIAKLSANTPPGEATAQNIAGNDNQTVWFEPYVAADPVQAGRFSIMILDASRTEMLVYETDDSGGTWAGPAVLGDRIHRVDKPAMAFGPAGALGIMWKKVDAPNLSFDVWAAASPRGDLGFGRPVRLSSRRSAEETCGLGGSEGQAYACDELSWMTMDSTHLDATWGDNRSGQNPWFGRYDFADDPQFHRG